MSQFQVANSRSLGVVDFQGRITGSGLCTAAPVSDAVAPSKAFHRCVRLGSATSRTWKILEADLE